LGRIGPEGRVHQHDSGSRGVDTGSSSRDLRREDRQLESKPGGGVRDLEAPSPGRSRKTTERKTGSFLSLPTTLEEAGGRDRQ